MNKEEGVIDKKEKEKNTGGGGVKSENIGEGEREGVARPNAKLRGECSIAHI